MSDSSQGPGWWLASDGRWYPPESRPYAGAPPPPGAARGQPAGAGWGAWGYGAGPSGYGAQPRSGAPPGYHYPAQPVALDDVLHLALAPWWKRLVAILVDWAVLGVGAWAVAIVVMLALGMSVHQQSGSSTPGSGPQAPATSGALLAGLLGVWLVCSLLSALYFGSMNGSRRGQTIGKMAMSIAVRDAGDGRPIGFWRAFGRYLAMALFGLLLVIPYLIDVLSPLWDRRRQSWHDHLVGSVVVDLRP